MCVSCACACLLSCSYPHEVALTQVAASGLRHPSLFSPVSQSFFSCLPSCFSPPLIQDYENSQVRNWLTILSPNNSKCATLWTPSLTPLTRTPFHIETLPNLQQRQPPLSPTPHNAAAASRGKQRQEGSGSDPPPSSLTAGSPSDPVSGGPMAKKSRK
jgi:hypothetical protein